MKLLRFPYLVQQAIMSTMDYQDLFLLSFCSKRMKNLVISSEKYRFKEVQIVKYKLIGGIVSIQSLGDETLDNKVIYPIFKIMIEIFRFNAKSNMISFKIPMERIGKKKYKIIRFPSTIEATLDHVLDIFGQHHDFLVCTYHLSDLRILSKLKNVKRSHLCLVGNTCADQLDEYFSASPKQKYIQCNVTLKGELKEDSGFYTTDLIDLHDHSSMSVGILKHFTGRKAFLRTERLENSDIIQFVQRWKYGKGHQNLEILIVRLDDYYSSFEPNEVKKSIRIENLSRNPPIFLVDTTYIFDSRSWKKPSFSSWTYVVRETDQHVASVMIEKQKFVFAVWNMTEEHFLQMDN
ncbi:hypothetical protein CRE_08059 [Caenorhabditis remanei]|uniref:F-box domain-containing protein n=1 Tax=Caenorhabditis remanei TaxID=31234 RepID=E3M352_CAERE|nr:hypothetical protein CRE_08059 [Caenorhabditis remanei]